MSRALLPTNVKPSHYCVVVTPDLAAFTFAGSVAVTLDILQETTTLVFHAVEIEIQKASLALASGSVAPTETAFDKEQQTCTLTFEAPIAAAQSGVLHLDFTGILNGDMAGFYRSKYQTASGETKYLGCTQFEATDCRRAFPSWDEPLLKATFDIVLRVEKDLVALSNMPVVSDTPIEGTNLREVTFATTPVMSTYLVAYVVGEFEYVEGKTAEGVVVRTYTPPGLKHEGVFSLDVAVKTLSYFSEFFAVAYPLPKLDLIAIPDFSAGAMENWGLVTFRTAILLFNENRTSAQDKQRIAYVVCHELAHQWFGNLVTMEWWTDLWLNEGFATWVGWLAADHIFPEWHVWDQFVVADLKRAMSLDALKSSHPIEVEVLNSAQIGEIFDAISYSKGASAIRMLVTYLGLPAFQEGIRSYLKQHTYGNAKTADLWEALGDKASQMMPAWTKQTGYPVIALSVGADGTLHASQERFLSGGRDETDTTVWPVPLRILSSTGSHEVVFAEKSQSLGVAVSGWLKANQDQSGIYRVSYSPQLLQELSSQISSLGTVDRVGLINDAFSLAVGGYSSTASALDLLRHYSSESAYIVWTEIDQRIGQLTSAWASEPEELRAKLNKFALSLYQGIASTIGWTAQEGEDHLHKLLRVLIIGRVLSLGQPEFVAQAKERFAAFVAGDETQIPTDLRTVVYATALRNGGAAEFEQLVELYKKAASADAKVHTLGAIGASRDPEVILRALEFALSSDVRQQDVITVTASVANNSAAHDIAWNFFKSNFQRFYDGFHAGSFLLGRIASDFAGVFSTEAKAQEIEAFFAEKNVASIDRAVKQAVESIRARARWLDADRAAVNAWLSANVQ